MPLSGTERAKIRHYLGYGVLYLTEDPTNVRLESAMYTLDSRPDALALVQGLITDTPPGILARLDDLEAKLLNAHSRKKAARVGSIELNKNELCDLRGEMARARADLSNMLEVPIYSSAGGSNYVGV